jgi:Icc-related predicted phosphoesterase
MESLKVKPDLFLIAGDMINRGEVQEWQKIYNVLFGKIFCPVVACFGNNEFQQNREELKQKYREVRFLDDQSIVLDIGKLSIGIFGTNGGLDTSTPWQRANIPNIEQIFKIRYDLTDRHLQRMATNVKILLMHYSPTYKTLEGENPRFFSTLGSQAYENILLNRKPDLVLHGHNYRGTKQAWVETVPVFNVSLPLNKEIVIIDTEKLKPGLAKFVKEI